MYCRQYVPKAQGAEGHSQNVIKESRLIENFFSCGDAPQEGAAALESRLTDGALDLCC